MNNGYTAMNNDKVFDVQQRLIKQKQLETKLKDKYINNSEDVGFNEVRSFQEVDLNENNVIQQMEQELIAEFGLYSNSVNAFNNSSTARKKLMQALKEPNFYHFSEKIIKYACDYLDKNDYFETIMELKHQYNDKIAKQKANQETDKQPIPDEVFNNFLKKFEKIEKIEEIEEELYEEETNE